MPLNLDQHLGVHANALGVHAKRGEMIARNLANADTPGYKARDLDFRAALSSAVESGTRVAAGGVRLQTTQAGHVGSANESSTAVADTDPALRYRTPLAPSLDGNTVDAQVEQAAFAENAVRYQATLTFLSSKFRGLMTALTGQ
jgi:flagellar basal-body rod protein FlgB